MFSPSVELEEEPNLINQRSKQGNVDICASAQPQVSMAGKYKQLVSIN